MEDFWSGPVQFYNSPIDHMFLIGLDPSTNGPLPGCYHKYVSVQTMPPGHCFSTVANINICQIVPAQPNLFIYYTPLLDRTEK